MIAKQLTAKERILAVVDEQPDDSSYDEILHELAFIRMIERGLADADSGRVVSHDDRKRRIEAAAWMEEIHEYIARDNAGAASRVVRGIYERHRNQVRVRRSGTRQTSIRLEPRTPVVRLSARVRQSHDLQVVVPLRIDQRKGSS